MQNEWAENPPTIWELMLPISLAEKAPIVIRAVKFE